MHIIDPKNIKYSQTLICLRWLFNLYNNNNTLSPWSVESDKEKLQKNNL